MTRHRPRRLRRTWLARETVAETDLTPARLVMPHFVLPAPRGRQPVPAMPGIQQVGLADLMEDVEGDLEAGIRRVLVFGLARTKDPLGKEGASPDSAAAMAVARLKERFGTDLLVAADVCLCPYTDHGHCGVLENGGVANDPTLPVLAGQALTLARAGADLVAPSDMMDGRVGAIRDALDAAGLTETGILSYTAKYASAYYGPFREAARSAPASGDRRSHQMDPRNRREALREAALDEQEGADILMIKPALPCLDVIASVRESTVLPVAAYNVSGEYAAVKLLAREGLAVERDLALENLTAIRRAGADLIVTYHARQAAREGWLR